MAPDIDRVALDRDGYLSVVGVLSSEAAGEVAARCLELLDDGLDRRMNDKASGGTRRASELLDRRPDLQELLRPALQPAVAHLLGDAGRLTDITFRCPKPGFGHQSLHRDGLPLGEPGEEDVVTCILALCDFTSVNGSTAVVPGSHVWPSVQPSRATERDEVRFIGPAGTAWVLNGHLLHRGTRNEADGPRPALQIFFGHLAATG